MHRCLPKRARVSFLFHMHTYTHAQKSGLCAVCKSEQAAAAALGYTQVSWDNASGEEKQPASTEKAWAELTAKEKAAASVLGYTAKSWDNDSGEEPQPASFNDKYWDELYTCGQNRS